MASARLLGTDGVRLADSGDCTAAIVKLEAAEKLYHAPTTLERLGECQIKTGRLVAGTESLNRVVREALPTNAPAAFVTARQRAQQALASALPRIGKLRIHVDGAPPAAVTVTVDGANVSAALFDADRSTDPGAHEITASASGYKTATTSVNLQDGAEAAVSLKLEVDPNAPPSAPGSPTSTLQNGTAPPLPSATASSPESATAKGNSQGLAIGALAVGGVGIAVGTVLGVMALGTKSTLDGECPTKTTCPANAQGDIDSLSSRATISTIGFGVGIVGVAVGAFLIATSHHHEAQSASRAASPVRYRPWFGLGIGGMEGRFE
jgi:hypothetical protein